MHSQCSLLVSWRFHEMGFLAFDKCHVAHVCMSILGFKSFLYCTVCFSKHLHDILTLYTSGSSSTAMRVLLLLRPFDFIMLHWPRCVFAAPGKHWSRGRIAELVMINLVPDDDAYFKRKFNAEILYEWDGNDEKWSSLITCSKTHYRPMKKHTPRNAHLRHHHTDTEHQNINLTTIPILTAQIRASELDTKSKPGQQQQQQRAIQKYHADNHCHRHKPCTYTPHNVNNHR